MITAGLLWLALQAAPDAFQVRFLHDGTCTEPCREESHWKVEAGGKVLDAFDDLAAVLQKEADAHRTGAPRPELSERLVFFDGSRGVPFNLVLGTMRRAADAGMYKMAWLKPGSEKGEMAYKFRLPDPQGPSMGCPKLEDALVVLKWDPKRREEIRRISGRPQVATIEELMPTIRDIVAFSKKAGKTETPVVIDAADDLTWNGVSWKEVLEVMDRCRAEGLEQFEFVPELRRKKSPPKPPPTDK